MAVHRLDLAEARRIAVRAQLLDAPRPTDLAAVVRQLTFLQIDPTAAVAPSADLVAWSRLGSSYQPAHLQHALEQDRTLFELNATVRPMSDLGLYLADMATWPSRDKLQEGCDSTTGFVATSSTGSAPPGRFCPATSRTPASCRGRRQDGPTTATSHRCSSSS